MSWMTAILAAVAVLAGLSGTSLAAASQTVATSDGGSGLVPNEGPNGGVCTVSVCANDPYWEFGGFDGNFPFLSGCHELGEPTGVKAPVHFEDEIWGEAELMVAPGCYSAVWVQVTRPESDPAIPPETMVINTFRLYSIRPAEAIGAQRQESEKAVVGRMLDGREGCIVAFVGVKPVPGNGYVPRFLTELEWGHCTPPSTETLQKEVIGGEVSSPGGKLPVVVPPLQPPFEVTRVVYESRPVTHSSPRPVVIVRVLRVEPKTKKSVKHTKHHKKSKGRKHHKKHRRPYGIESGGGA